MSTKRAGTTPLWVAEHGEAERARRRVCCECGGKLTGRQQRWCGKACVHAYLLRGDPAYARRAVFTRDRGVCAKCGLDTKPIADQVTDVAYAASRKLLSRERAVRAVLRPHGMARYWRRTSFWDMDHVVPVADGGGECDLDNLRTLCLYHHRAVTRAWRHKRSKKGRG